MKESCRYHLDQLAQLVSQMSNAEYAKSCTTLFGASIGQHTRHILELYLELIKGVERNEICYDNRPRNGLLETEVRIAMDAIQFIQSGIHQLQDGPVTLLAQYSNGQRSLQLATTVYRELAYQLEHSIHHQALIKIGLVELGKSALIHANFGVAPSTIRFKEINLYQTKK